LCCVQLMSTDYDVTPAHRPIIVAACHDVIDGRLLSWQRSPGARDVTVQAAADCCVKTSSMSCGSEYVVEVQSVAMKVEQRDNDDVSQTDSAESTDIAAPCQQSVSPGALQPLDLTSRPVGDGTNTSSSDTNAGLRTSHVTTQILLLKGQRYEILPLGDGRWMSRSEFELISALKNRNDNRRPSLSGDESTFTSPTENKCPLDDVNGNTCDVSTRDPCHQRQHTCSREDKTASELVCLTHALDDAGSETRTSSS